MAKHSIKTVKLVDPDADDQSPRERIFSAAMDCIRELGVRRTTMEKIAAAAGLSRPTIYYYYPDKLAVLEDVILRNQAEAHRDHRQILTQNFRGLAAVVEAIILGVERAHRDPFSIEFARPEVDRLTARVLQSDAALELRRAYWRPLLADARERGELHPDMDDEAVIGWIVFLQFAIVTNGALFGLTDRRTIEAAMRTFLVPALGTPARASSMVEVDGDKNA